ncbi:MAG: YhgE/Pip family protein [Microbacterium sp.]|uniref:YhgE/Pip family protein n=1 Tax=Microbacterium sp. TaxID=51671 RepID=UPI003A8C5BEA
MRNILHVFTRDALRILKAPMTWAIVLGIIILPSLYAWVNIIAFWDPYGNTQKVKVAVVNLDEGATSSVTGPLNVGDQVIDQLKDNHQLDWQFLGHDAAMTAVESGASYAAIVIPHDFSKDLLSVVTGTFVAPELEYYVNEKANAIAPKITGVGASTLDTQVNSTFVSMVAKTVAQTLEKAGITLGDQLLGVQDTTTSTLAEAAAKVEASRAGLADVETSLTDVRGAVRDTRGALQAAGSAIGGVQSEVRDAQALVAQAQQQLLDFTDSVTQAYVSGSALLVQAVSKLDATVGTATAAAQRTNAEIGSAVKDVSAVVDANGRMLAQLQEILNDLDGDDPARDPLAAAIDRLQQRNAADEQLLNDLTALNSEISGVIASIQSSADALEAAVDATVASMSTIGKTLTDTLPEINRAISAMSATAGAFATSLDIQRQLVGEAADLLGDVDHQLGDTDDALTALGSNLDAVTQGLQQLSVDSAAISSADVWNKVAALTSLNPEQIAEFMAAPVEVKTNVIYPVPTYGSAMAPLFTNLTLWIGSFMLVVLLRQEPDTEGVPTLTVRQGYLGRFLLLSVLGFLQALLVSIGNMVIGVHMVNPVAFAVTAVFAGWVFLSIIYALAVCFGYVGKGIAILLVVIQIPGASGIYPIQMMPQFFQDLFPFFPFTYSIDAMRETIGGFYDGYYWRSLAALLVFAALAFLLGIFFRQRLGNFSRLFNRKLADTGLFVSEDVQVLGSRRRLTQLAQALVSMDEFRAQTAHRADWLRRSHFTVVSVTLVGALAITVLLGILAALFPTEKATILGAWGVLCLVVIAILVTLEYVKQNIGFAKKLESMPVPELREWLAAEEEASHSSVAIDRLKVGGEVDEEHPARLPG